MKPMSISRKEFDYGMIRLEKRALDTFMQCLYQNEISRCMPGHQFKIAEFEHGKPEEDL